MSIATLKKKTASQYNNMSVGSKTGFSLNGTHRSQGYVGQSVISRSLPRTLMKGNVVCGHGGCCGTYTITPIVQSAVRSTENINVVKHSVLNNMGMISTKYRWIRRPEPYATVKPDATLNLNTEGDYIFKISRLHQRQVCAGSTAKPSPNCCSTEKTTAKPEGDYVAISQGEYIAQLQSQCEPLDTEFQLLLKSPMKRMPFSC